MLVRVGFLHPVLPATIRHDHTFCTWGAACVGVSISMGCGASLGRATGWAWNHPKMLVPRLDLVSAGLLV